MPASYSIDSEHGLVHSVGTGALTDADVLGHNERLKQDAQFQPTFCNFWDLTDVDQLHIGLVVRHAGAGGKHDVVRFWNAGTGAYGK